MIVRQPGDPRRGYWDMLGNYIDHESQYMPTDSQSTDDSNHTDPPESQEEKVTKKTPVPTDDKVVPDPDAVVPDDKVVHDRQYSPNGTESDDEVEIIEPAPKAAAFVDLTGDDD
jgi:hypothetical protein